MRWSQLQPALFERTADGLAFPSKVEPIVWTIPGTDAKNGLAHEVPLSGAVMDLLRDLATRDEAERLRINSTSRVKRNQTARPVSEYVFPSRKTDGPYLEIQKAVERLRKRSGFGFTAHDLRRTAATLMADAGVPENIIPTILDHTEPGVTRRHYNLHAYRSEKRAALETWARYAENMRLDAQLRLCHNQTMDLQVFAPAELTSEAKRFLAPFEVNSIVSPMRAIQDEPLRGDRFLLYLSGREDEDQLTKPLKSFARVKRRLLMVVLYARQADHRNVVLWARAAERALPDHTEFCFSVTEVARALKLRPRTRAATRQSPDGRRIDIDALRTALGLTQAQLAVAIGVSERTVQNWEAGRVSPQAERRLRDLIELNETLDRYIDPEQRQSWLISPNDASAGNAPRDWIIEGRPRDLLWEFRRMQVGEPV